jgi:DNA invertase Pin-like site-specific DNA recombinase
VGIPKMRVAIYTRVSTAEQDNENQLISLREYGERQGHHMVGEYIDICSGGKADRHQFKQMLSDAGQRKFDLLLFWSLDRLSREGALATLQYLQLLTSYGVGYRSFTEQYLDSLGPFRDAVLAILACIARQERIRLSERTRAGLAKAKAKGKVGGRPRSLKPYEREEASCLRELGWSWGAIGRKLKVHADTVKRALKQSPGMRQE